MPALAVLVPTGEPLTGWYVGMIIAAVVIVVVVILVVSILSLARRIGDQARSITLGLDQSRKNTMALWEVPSIADAIGDINDSAAAARGVLQGLP